MADEPAIKSIPMKAERDDGELHDVDGGGDEDEEGDDDGDDEVDNEAVESGMSLFV